MNRTMEAIVSVLVAVVGVAIIAVLVSKNANTAGVVSSAGGAFSSILKAATSPVTGGGAPGMITPGG